MRAAPILLLVALVAFVLWKLRQTARRVLGADGRKFVEVFPGTPPDDSGMGQAAIWRPDPPDGFDYTPDLGWQAGVSTGAPMFRRFV